MSFSQFYVAAKRLCEIRTIIVLFCMFPFAVYEVENETLGSQSFSNKTGMVLECGDSPRGVSQLLKRKEL